MPNPAAWSRIVQRCFEEDRVLYSRHARQEMRQDEFGRIWEKEVYEAVNASEVIRWDSELRRRRR